MVHPMPLALDAVENDEGLPAHADLIIIEANITSAVEGDAGQSRG